MPTLSSAFDLLVGSYGRKVTIERPDEISPTNIKIMPSNYFRNLAGPEETIVTGAEFIVSKSNLVESNFPRPKRGDVISDDEMGYLTISEVREMFDLGGAIMGYRLRTE
jgi:hypothetical protein